MALSVAASLAGAATFTEDFASDPQANGWKVFGDANLFYWNETNGNVEATWDSSKPNSYFYRPLGTILTTNDDFSLQFDLRMDDIAIGVNPTKPGTFQVALGLMNLREATRTNFFIGSGTSANNGPRSLMEFDYFPDGGLGATFSLIAVSTNNVFGFCHNVPLELTIADVFRINMDYHAASRIVSTTVLRNGEPYGLAPGNYIKDLVLTNKPDFRLDAVAIESYSDDHPSSPTWAGSLLAHGVVDNFVLTFPPPPVQNLRWSFTNEVCSAEFLSRTNWRYVLETTADLQQWSETSARTNGTGATVLLSEAAAPGASARFYRLKAERP